MLVTRLSAPPLGLARRLAAAVALPLVLALWLAAAPAQAVVTEVGGKDYGVTFASNSRFYPNPEHLFTEHSPTSFASVSGGPVMHVNNVYAIYWDPSQPGWPGSSYPSGFGYHGDWKEVIDGYLQNVGSESGKLGDVYAVDAQYTDKTGNAAYSSVFRGAYTDTNPYPAEGGCKDPENGGYEVITCLSDQQIQTQLQSFIAQHGLSTGMGSMFVVLTPPQVEVCVDGGPTAKRCSENTAGNQVCSYHSAITPTNPATGDGSTVIYDVVPWIDGLDDGHLPKKDRERDEPGEANPCQDAGWDPSPPNDDSEREGVLPNKETPAIQEPNQLTTIGPDGTWDHGLADLIINQISVDEQNTITDPLLNGWQDENRYEVMDECQNAFLPTLGGGEAPLKNTFAGNLYNQAINGATYYLNNTFNLAGVMMSYPGIPCMHGVNLVPGFTAPNPVHSGELISFDGTESDITLDWGTSFATGSGTPTYSTFTWNFGDGTPEVTGYAPGGPSVNSPGATPCAAPWLSPCAASTYHSYQYGGTYQVTLTVKDVAGNTANITKSVTVVGPPPPPPPPPPSKEGTGGPSSGSSGSSGGSQGAGSGAGGSSGSTGAPTPEPVASAASSSRSLLSVLKKGLVVSYTVNEQVAGHFEVLLNSALARRLGIHGPLAQGLPKGTPNETVIAQAILVTTQGGHNQLRLQFSKHTSARLHRLRRVTLMLRLFVRNASSQSPKTTTVLSTVVLSR